MTGFTIIPVWDKSVLNSPDKVEFEDAVEKAIANIEAKVTTNETIKIDFGYGVMPYDGSSTGQGGAESIGNTAPFSWTQVYDAFEKEAKSASASAVQKAAAALLTKDNAKYGTVLNSDMMDVTEAQAKALGLSLAGFAGSGPYDGWVGLGSGPFDWAQNNANQEDAVSAFEHEITEVMGRVDNLGVPNGNPGDYTLLDMFHYGSSPSSKGGGTAPGSAAGALDEPFVAGYNAKDVSYFSYNGSTITWQYDIPSEVAQPNGEDVADWSTTNTNRPAATDSFDGAGGDAIDPPISLPDWEEVGVLGYGEKPAVDPVDFTGGGLSDILWRRNTSGGVGLWDSNGSGGFTHKAFGVVSNSYQVVGVGDFNGDGVDDVLFRNASSGADMIWESNGHGGFTSDNPGTVSTSWSVAGTGDFNGDGETDILFHDASSGANMIWESNGKGGFTSDNPGALATSWSVAGTGDFNGDGRSDILWHNSSGATELWLSNDKGGFATDNLGTVATSWQVAGVGDFSGDGEASILWRNKSTGADMIWESNGSGGFIKNVNPGSMAASWSVAGIGDFNGDGVDGILWRNTSGALEVWDSNGAGGFVAHSLGNVSMNWKVVAA